MEKKGQSAPDFALLDQDGQTVRLSNFVGKKVVLYFYPKDDTPGCTRQAIGFSELLSQFDDANTVVLGISKDSWESHQKFAQKHGLSVTLLSDPEGHVLEAYGVWQEKSNYGKTYMGVVRTTFLIDEQGVIEKSWENVKVDGHMQAVLGAVCEAGR